MSLFDDLLKQTTGNKVQDDPLATATTTSSDSIIITDATPMITAVEDREPVPPVAIIQPSASSQTMDDSSSIIMSVDETPSSPMMSDTVTPVDTLISEIPENIGLFDMTSSPEVIVEQVDSTVDEGAPVVFTSTEELLAKEIADIDAFLAGLATADAAKLDQEAEYKSQKEHFAELEAAADADHKKILEEKAHAEKMKSYLEHESSTQMPEEVITAKVSKKTQPVKETETANEELFDLAA